MIETDKARRAASYKARGKSVMFSAVYNDGRTGYFVIEGHGTSKEDYLAVQVAQEHQRTGELPESILSIKHGDFKHCEWLHAQLACFVVIWKHMGSPVGPFPGKPAASEDGS